MSPTTPASPHTAEAAPTGEEGWRLRDERDFLVRSLADAESEHAAGDLNQRDYAVLRRRDTARLAAVEQELADLETTRTSAAIAAPNSADPVDQKLRSARRRTWLAMLGTALVVAGAVLLVVRLTSPRLPGQNGDGGIQQDLAQRIQTQLEQATILVNGGSAHSLEQALGLYNEVLAEEPRQPQALAESGYLLWETGVQSGDASLVSGGRARVLESIKVEQDDYAAHLFLGNIDLESGIPAGSAPAGGGPGVIPASAPAGSEAAAVAAVAQYRLFLNEKPPLTTVQEASTLIQRAFSLAHQPLPAASAIK